jgi:hypothetical protein
MTLFADVEAAGGDVVVKPHDGLEERVPSVGKGECNLPVVLEPGLMGVIMSGSIK